MKEAININSNIGSVLSCLRTLKWNQNHHEVPFENKINSMGKGFNRRETTKGPKGTK